MKRLISIWLCLCASVLLSPLAALASTGLQSGDPGPTATVYNNRFYSCVVNYYVATNGSDSYDGTAATYTGGNHGPWLTIQNADTSARMPGDCINVAAGTYNENVLIQHGGNAPRPVGYLAYRCQAIDACHVIATSGGFLWGLEGSGNFVVVDGFELDGNKTAQTGGLAAKCIGSDFENYGTANTVHHIWVLNNIIHDCNQSGVQLNQKEWFYVEFNEVYGNSNTSGSEGSGISLASLQCIEVSNKSCASGNTMNGGTGTYSPSFMDTSYLGGTFHVVVAGNNVHGNMEINPYHVACGNHTDGNGIIMDTFYDAATLTIFYPSQTLLTLNVSYGNGGRGIHLFRASNITVSNNTVYGNELDLCDNATVFGDLSNLGGANNTWISNVSQAVLTKNQPCGTQNCGGYNSPLVAGGSAGVNDANNIWSNNITFGANPILTYAPDVVNCSTSGANQNLCATNPNLYSSATGNFEPMSTSPALNYSISEPWLPTGWTAAGTCRFNRAHCP